MSSEKEGIMNSMLWVALFMVALGINIGKFHHISYGIGATIPLIVFSMALSGMWWGVQKLRKKHWGLIPWLNVASIINLLLMLFSVFVSIGMQNMQNMG